MLMFLVKSDAKRIAISSAIVSKLKHTCCLNRLLNITHPYMHTYSACVSICIYEENMANCDRNHFLIVY